MTPGRRYALALGGVIVFAIGMVAASMLSADATTAILTGQYCTPRGGVYRTPTITLVCAQSISSTRRVDTAFRWRDIGVGCPKGYVRRDIAPLLHQASGVHILACAINPIPPVIVPTSPGVTQMPTPSVLLGGGT